MIQLHTIMGYWNFWLTNTSHKPLTPRTRKDRPTSTPFLLPPPKYHHHHIIAYRKFTVSGFGKVSYWGRNTLWGHFESSKSSEVEVSHHSSIFTQLHTAPPSTFHTTRRVITGFPGFLEVWGHSAIVSSFWKFGANTSKISHFVFGCLGFVVVFLSPDKDNGWWYHQPQQFWLALNSSMPRGTGHRAGSCSTPCFSLFSLGHTLGYLFSAQLPVWRNIFNFSLKVAEISQSVLREVGE